MPQEQPSGGNAPGIAGPVDINTHPLRQRTVPAPDKAQPAVSRSEEGNGCTPQGRIVPAKLAQAAGREVLFLGDAPGAAFGLPPEVRALELPKAPAEWPELAAFFNHLPTDLLSSYLCEMWGGHYFRDGSSGSFTAGEVTTIWGQPGMSTLKGSKIVIVEEEQC